MDITPTTVDVEDERDDVHDAYERLAHLVRRRAIAGSLTDRELDVLIAELVATRHARIEPGQGYQDAPNFVTVVTQRRDRVTIASMGTRLDRDELVGFARERAHAGLTGGAV